MSHKSLVKDGYDAIASAYAKDQESRSEDISLLSGLVSRLPKGSRVLDAGCGGGVPVARALSQSFRVVGLDFSIVQVRLARTQVPRADAVLGELTRLPFRNSCFDGLCSYYAIIHVPREEHRDLIRDFHRVLRPAGVALLCMGEQDLPGEIGEYMGTRMFWSHFDGETNDAILRQSGFTILRSEKVVDWQDPSSRHRIFLVRKE